MAPTWGLVFAAIIISFLAGWFFALHPTNLLSDADTFYNWSVGRLHGVPQCPKGYACTPATAP